MTTANTLPYNTPSSSPRGASMGRPNVPGAETYSGRLNVRRVPLRSSGYDQGGAYWGRRSGGWALFCAFAPDRSVIVYFDAMSDGEAREMMRARYPAAKIKGA